MDKKPLYKKILSSLKSSKEYKIVFIGDSLTSGEWVHPNWRGVFEYILKFSFEEFNGNDWWIPEWNLKFFNYALDGASTRDFKKQVERVKLEINPDLYIIMGTSNDKELNISIDEHVQNLEEIFKLLIDKDVIYSPSIYSDDKKSNDTYQEYVDSILRKEIPENITIVNGFNIFKNYPIQKFYTLDLDREYDSGIQAKKDPIHPNALGNVYISKMFLEEVFGIEVNPERFLNDTRSDIVKYPRW